MNVIPKPRNPNRDKAFEIYKYKAGNIKPTKIAEILNEKVTNIRSWKSSDEWDNKLGINKKVGAPKGNQNALGHKGGPPKGNQNNRKHGFYSKHLPAQVYNIFEEIDNMDTLDILWTNIKVKFANILRAQKIMYVKNSKDHIKELVKETKGKVNSREFEMQFAWDRQERLLKAESTAMKDLSRMIKDYEDILHKNWDLVSEEQKLRIEKLKGEVNHLKKDDYDESELTIVVDYGDDDVDS